MVLDGAGWHQSKDLAVPNNITLVVLPPYSPELNPVERVWLYLRERFPSLRLFESIEAIIGAWNRLVAEQGRIRSLCAYPWIEKLCSRSRWYETSLSDCFYWRKGWDSNPRMLAHRRFSRPVQSTTLPPFRGRGFGFFAVRAPSSPAPI